MKQGLKIWAVTVSVLPFVFSGGALANQEPSFEKPEIEAFINHVWENNPALAEAQARVLAAQAAQKAASRWQYNPEVSVEFEDVDGSDTTNRIGLSQTIDWRGKSGSAGASAALSLYAVEADRDVAAQDTAIEVLSALANYRAAKDIMDLAVERSALMERFSALAQKGFRAGDIDQGEYNLAQLSLSEALIAQAEAQSALAQEREALDASIGFSLRDDFNLPSLPKNLPQLPALQNEEQILMKLPHIRALKNREDAARSLITGARKNRFADPTIGLVGGKDSGADVIGLSLSMPLYVFNSYGAEVDVAKQEALAQAKAGQQAYHRAKMRLKSTRVSYELSRKAWVNWKETGAQALAEQVDILDRKFKVGDLSATDYLVQIEQALGTKVAAKALHAKVWRSWFAWLEASGTVQAWIQNSGE